MSIEDWLWDSDLWDSVSSTVPRSIFGLFNRPTVPIPTVAMGFVSDFDPSDFMGMFSRPNDIVGGVSPDSVCNPAGLRDCEHGGIGGGVRLRISNILDSSPNESGGRRLGGIGGGVSPPPSRSAVHSSAASDTGGTAGGVSPPPSRSTEKSPAAWIIDLMDSSFWDEIHSDV